MKLSETKRDLLLLLCLSAILKVSIAFFTEVINHDGVLYITAAQELSAGHLKAALHTHRMLFYPSLIVLIHYLIPNWMVAARLVSLTASVLTLIPLYLLTRDLLDRKVALWCSAAFALSPLPNHLSVEVIRDPSYIFFFAWTIYFAQCAMSSKRLNYFLLASVFSSLSLLCRLEGVILFPCFIIFICYLALRNPKDRSILLKGLSIYVIFPVIFFGVASLALQAKVDNYIADVLRFNRVGDIIKPLKVLFSFKFLENYHLMYQKLKIFEQSFSVNGGGKYLIELVRQYMPAIYFIGFFEALSEALFLPFILPLGLGLKSSKVRNSAFMFFLVSCYLLMLYCALILIGHTRERIFLAPAFILYPWIGAGIDRIVAYLKDSSRQRLIAIFILLLFGVLPIYKSVKILWQQDTVLVKAGKWIADIPEFQTAKIITNDRRAPFYAGRGVDFVFYLTSDFSTMERIALSRQIDLLIIEESKKKEIQKLQLKKFRKVKEFVGKKNMVIIYCSPKLYRSISGKKL
jgi:4-amino-4-deoxy-L-arabinose transferase-like glycosyltransferase